MALKNNKLALLEPRALDSLQLSSISKLPHRLSYSLNLKELPRLMEQAEGKRVMAISAGGTNLVRGDFKIEKGCLKLIKKTVLVKYGRSGRGYFNYFEKIGEEARKKNVPVGVAYAAAINTSTGEILEDANLGELRKKVKNVKNLRRTVSTLKSFGTDSLMSVIAGIALAKAGDAGITGGIGFINGTGIGSAVYKENRGMGQIYSVSPEHVKVVKSLLSFDKFKNRKISVEEAAAGPGMEKMYKELTGKSLDASAISKLARKGDKQALGLFSQSAYLGAHVIVGLGRSFGLLEKQSRTALILEGSLCDESKVPGYASLLLKTVEKNTGLRLALVGPGEEPAPLSLTGAALSAIIAC